MVFQVAALIPAGMAIAKAQRNASDASDGSNNKPLAANRVRTQRVVDRLTAGGSGAPISHLSDQQSERMIKINEASKAHESELRAAHTAGRDLIKAFQFLDMSTQLGTRDVSHLSMEE